MCALVAKFEAAAGSTHDAKWKEQFPAPTISCGDWSDIVGCHRGAGFSSMLGPPMPGHI